MKPQEWHNEAALSADFASRVVKRVRKARRLRRLRRRVLTCAAAGAAALVAVLWLHAGGLILQPTPVVVAEQNSYLPSEWAAPIELGSAPDSGMIGVSQPLAFFFPGATAAADFESSSAASWHSYDSWWNPNP